MQAFLCDLVSGCFFALSFLSPLTHLAPVITVFLHFLHHLEFVSVSEQNGMCCLMCPSLEIFIASPWGRIHFLIDSFPGTLPVHIKSHLPFIPIYALIYIIALITTWHYFIYSSVYYLLYHLSINLLFTALLWA